MMRATVAAAAGLLLFALPAWADVPVTLRGSPESMLRQNRIAQESDFDFLRTAREVRRAVEAGELVPVNGDENYELAYRSFPYARPELRHFIERLAEEYHAGCGEKLFVTSLTRPMTQQPPNAHPLSVHPAGMAVDLRISQKAACQRWIEAKLLGLEEQGILDITREQNPPHYHVALFPDAYFEHVVEVLELDGVEAELIRPARAGGVPGDDLGAHALVPMVTADVAPASVEAEPRTGWLTRLLTLPVRLLGRLRIA